KRHGSTPAPPTTPLIAELPRGDATICRVAAGVPGRGILRDWRPAFESDSSGFSLLLQPAVQGRAFGRYAGGPASDETRRRSSVACQSARPSRGEDLRWSSPDSGYPAARLAAGGFSDGGYHRLFRRPDRRGGA